MMHRNNRFPSGLTLLEMMVCMAILLIVIAGIGVALADGLRDWQRMYDCLYSNLAADSRTAPRMLDLVVRSAAGQQLLIGTGGGTLEVWSYADAGSTAADRYARLYSADGDLHLESGRLTPKQMEDSRVICENVASCTFLHLGRAVQMVLVLDDGTQRKTVTSSAFIHSN